MDLEKLTPAPWFVEMARNAFDVMMRRGWSPFQDYSDGVLKWFAMAPQVPKELCGPFPDPFTALVEPDKWMKDQEANDKGPAT